MLFSKKLSRNDNYNFYMILLIIDIMTIIIGGKINFISRIGLYFKIPALTFLLPSFNTIIKEKENSHIISNTLIVLLLVVYL